MRKFGTDSFRLYLYQTNAMLIGDLLFDENGIRDTYQQILLPYWNACKFFISYADIDGYFAKEPKVPSSDNLLDKWVLAKLYETEKNIRQNMDAYQVNKYVVYIAELVDGLTNWYIRRSRRRFWGKEMIEDKKNAYETLHYVLLNTTKLLAPVAPILSEDIYQLLVGNTELDENSSVHLADWPVLPDEMEDAELLSKIDLVQDTITLGRSIRNKNKVKNRQPLSSLYVALPDASLNTVIEEFSDIIAEELNVKKVEILDVVDDIATVNCVPNFNEIRGRYPDRIPMIIGAIKKGKFQLLKDKALVEINGKQEELDPEVILVTYKAKEGHNVESKKGIVVSLDLTLNPELVEEGIARDVIRNIQDARKQLGCEITERILLSVQPLKKRWIEAICAETLADLAEIDDPDAELVVKSDHGKDITVMISRK